VLEQQVLCEREARLAADADNAAMWKEYHKERAGRTSAEQKVCYFAAFVLLVIISSSHDAAAAAATDAAVAAAMLVLPVG